MKASPDVIISYIIIAILIGVPSIKFKALDKKGALSAFFLGLIISISLGIKALFILLSFYIAATIATKIGYEEKSKRKTEQKTRSVGNTLSNGLVAAVSAFLAGITNQYSAVFFTCYVAAVSEAAADTISNELGQLSSEKPRLITNLEKVEPGEHGAVSLFGTLIGVAAVVFTSFFAYYLGIIKVNQSNFFLIVFIAAAVGNLADSFLGATFERRGKIDNNGVNLISALFTFIAAFNLSVLLGVS